MDIVFAKSTMTLNNRILSVELKEKTPKVSVCVVTYNQDKYIRQCLQSIVEQVTDFDFEVIVGDDCSTDGTPEIVRDFAARYPKVIRPIFRTNNIGPYQNYIDTHSVAIGKYVAHCDGDDFWFPGKISFQAKFLDKNTNVNAIFTNAVSNSKIKYKKHECGLFLIETVLRKVFTRNLCVHSSILERRMEFDVGDEIEMFDFELYWTKHKNSLIYIAPFVGVSYSQNEQGISKQKNYINKLKGSLSRFKERAIESSTFNAMNYDFYLMKYLSNPVEKKRPSIIMAIKLGYKVGVLLRLCAPTGLYRAIKHLKA